MLHCADIHLDMPFTSLGSTEGKAGQRRIELKEAFHRIIELSIREKADLLLICGDLYEHEYVRKSTINFICEELGRISNTRVILLPGNHDPYLPGSFYMTYPWPDNVHILAGEKAVIELEEPCARISGSLKPSLEAKPSCIDILMLHGTLNMGIARNAFNPLTSDQLDLSGADYIALGHFHNRFEAAGKIRTAFNPGSPEPLGFDEEGSHGVYLAEIIVEDSGRKHSEIRFVPISRRNYRNVAVHCENYGNDEKIAAAVEAVMREAGSREDLYSITLKGTVEAGHKADIRRLEASLAHGCFFIRMRDNTVPGYDFDEIKKEPGLRGLFVKKLLERIRQAEMSGDEEGRLQAADALYYGMQALEQGEIWL